MKKIFTDVDGVILDFEKGFIRWIQEKFNLQISEENPDLFWKQLAENPNINTQNLDHEFVFSSGVAKLPSLVNVAEFNQLSQKYETCFLTNFPHKAIEYRKQNLKNLGFHFSKVFCGGFFQYGEENYPLKSEVILRETTPADTVFFLDDLSQNCEDIKTNVPYCNVALMSHPANLHEEIPSDWRRINQWKDFIHFVETT